MSWRYHLRTAGSVLLVTALVMVILAAGVLLSGSDTGAVPGTGVTPIPAPAPAAP